MTIISIDPVAVFKRLAAEFNLDSYTVSYCCARAQSEGMQFLTVTLPKLGKEVLASLEKGYFDRQNLTCFAWKRRSLRVFRSLLKGIFDEDTGLLLQQPDPFSIWGIRQISEYFYKLALDFSEKQLESAELDYIKVEQELADGTYDKSFAERVRRNIEGFYNFPRSFDAVLASDRPRLGPGTFSGCQAGALPWYLYKCSTGFQHSVLRRFKALAGFFKPYPACPQRQTFTEADSNTVAEVLFVPKDSRGPRVISREPIRQLSLQMAYFDWFSKFLERSTRKRVNFQDQQVNRDLAKLGSINGSYATFDLKEASDRLRGDLVDHLFRYIPAVRFFLKHRVREVKLPSGKLLKIKKLAGMGSGLTFATMACVIHAAISTEIALRFGVTFSVAALSVYVYGDDVIVPSGYAGCVVPALEKVGLKANQSKCFKNLHLGRSGYFRESCGGDYFNGNDIAPVRLRLSGGKPEVRKGCGLLRLTVKGDGGILQLERHARQLYINGLLGLAEYYYSNLEQRIGKLPRVGVGSSVLGRATRLSPDYTVDQFGNYELIKALVPVSPTVEYNEDPYHRLARSLISMGEEPVVGVPYGRVTIPRSVRLVRRRVSSFAMLT